VKYSIFVYFGISRCKDITLCETMQTITSIARHQCANGSEGSNDMLELNFSMLPLHLHPPSALLRHLLYSFIYV